MASIIMGVREACFCFHCMPLSTTEILLYCFDQARKGGGAKFAGEGGCLGPFSGPPPWG